MLDVLIDGAGPGGGGGGPPKTHTLIEFERSMHSFDIEPSKGIRQYY